MNFDSDVILVDIKSAGMFSEGRVLSQHESALSICNVSKADKAQVFMRRLPNTDISRCYPQKLWIIYVQLIHAPADGIRPGAARMRDNARALQLTASVNSNMPSTLHHTEVPATF
jgi:hypothetical protein